MPSISGESHQTATGTHQQRGDAGLFHPIRSGSSLSAWSSGAAKGCQHMPSYANVGSKFNDLQSTNDLVCRKSVVYEIAPNPLLNQSWRYKMPMFFDDFPIWGTGHAGSGLHWWSGFNLHGASWNSSPWISRLVKSHKKSWGCWSVYDLWILEM